MHDSSNCPTCQGLPASGSISDAQFHAFLIACRNEMADKQSGFLKRIEGASRWSYDMKDCSLFIDEQRFPMTPVGSHSPAYETWLWSWANDDLPPAAREASRRLQALHTRTGFQVFLDPGTEASSTDAQDFTALALHQLGAIGFFRVPSEGPTLFLAIHEPTG